MQIPPLESLGPRIMVCGPSNAGKSTLARALAERLGTSAIHLDTLFHQPGTNWVPRPREEFAALHDATVASDRWVIEGNYFGVIAPRLERATGIVLLGSRPWRGLFRYVRRTLFERNGRAGMLEGGIDRLNWKMVRFILVEQPPKRARDVTILRASGKPLIVLEEMDDLRRLYAAWALRR